VFTFQTPSGNIQCSGGEDFGGTSDVICEIIQRNGPPALPQPAACPGPWGHRFSLSGRGPVTMDCGLFSSAGGGSEVAPYGVTGHWGDITCLSERTGFQCRNADGHGFFLSRARQSVF
jgi:hypothetical protein